MTTHEFIEKASVLKICVVGDAITDRYIFGEMTRISPEAPVPILRITGTRENPGGAGNVVENLRGLGCDVKFFHQPNPPIKTRIMSGNHHILRMDDEDAPAWMKFDDFNWELWHHIEHRNFDCVVISDYSKGCISKDVATTLINLCADSHIPVCVDTKHQLDIMQGATLVKCNKYEWESLDRPFPEEVFSWMESKDVKSIVITNGASGMTYHSNVDYEEQGHVPGIPVNLVDPCGAGDTVIAVLAVCTALNIPIDKACELANIAAAEVCKYPGVVPITKELLINLIK